MTAVEFRQSMPIVYGFANHNHSGEGQIIALYYVSQMVESATIDVLIGPSEVIASSDRSVRRIFFEQLSLNIIYY